MPVQCQGCSRSGGSTRNKIYKNPCPPGRLKTRYIIVYETEINAKKTSRAERQGKDIFEGLWFGVFLCKDLLEVNLVAI